MIATLDAASGTWMTVKFPDALTPGVTYQYGARAFIDASTCSDYAYSNFYTR